MKFNDHEKRGQVKEKVYHKAINWQINQLVTRLISRSIIGLGEYIQHEYSAQKLI